VLDYTHEDYTRSGQYDLILDLVSERSVFAIRRSVAPGGRYSVVGGRLRSLLAAVTIGKLLGTDGRKFGLLAVRPNPEDFRRLAAMVIESQLRVHVARTYPLSHVHNALGDLGAGRVLGKLVIEVG